MSLPEHCAPEGGESHPSVLEALRESEARQLAIMETALDCIVIMDHEGRIRGFNAAAERTFGYRAADVLGAVLCDVIIPPDARPAHTNGLAHYIATEEGRLLGRRIEVSAMRADGSEFPAELAITQVRPGERPLFTAHLRDISERRALEAELRALNQDLEERVKERTEEVVWANLELLRAKEELQAALCSEQELGEVRANFVSTVSHEFRTPLGIILSSAEILDKYHGRLNDDQRRDHVRQIRKSVEQMSELMEEVLVFHRVGADVDEWSLEPLDLATLCRRLADEVCSATGHRCPITFEVGALPPAFGDERLLRHLFGNLLSNGVKYSADKSPVVFAARAEGNLCELTVADRGIGIPAADLPRLFDPFRRGSNVGRRSGTGLGLAITAKCVKLHRGEIAVESVLGQGTTITVTLPLFAEAAT